MCRLLIAGLLPPHAGQPTAAALPAWQHLAAADDAPGGQPGPYTGPHGGTANTAWP
jgi:hypothetical protein